jgi:hypothetical protein
MKEICIVEIVTNYLGDKSYQIVTELPFLQRHVDIVGYDMHTRTIVAIEAKVKNWQSALRQATTCLLFADEVYIAMPPEFIHRVDRSAIARFGIGLMEVNETVTVISEAVSSMYNSDHHRKQVITSFHWLKEIKQKGKYDANQ